MALRDSNAHYEVATYSIDILAILIVIGYIAMVVFIGMNGFIDLAIVFALFLIFGLSVAITNEFGFMAD